MTDDRTRCHQCHRPTGDNAHLCQTCTNTLEQTLAEIPALAAQLTITLTRQARIVGPAFTTKVIPDIEDVTFALSAKPQPLPFHYGASEAGYNLLSALRAAALEIAQVRGMPYTGRMRPADLSRWLLNHLEWMRHAEQAAEYVDEIVPVVNTVRQVIDRSPDRVYLGTCGDDGLAWRVASLVLGDDAGDACDGELYALEGAPAVTCERCGHLYDVAERRAWLEAEAEDRLATIVQLQHFLADSRHDDRQVRNMLDGYVRRGRLVPRGATMVLGLDGVARERSLYRVGDARELLAEAWTRRQGGVA